MWDSYSLNDILASPMSSSSGLKLRNSLCRRVKSSFCLAYLTTATTTSVGLRVQRASTYKHMNKNMLSLHKSFTNSLIM